MAGRDGLKVDPSLFALPGVWRLADLFGVGIGQLRVMKGLLPVSIFVLLACVWALPNAQQFLRKYPTALQQPPQPNWLQRLLPALTWRPSITFGVSIGWVGFFLLLRALSAAPTEFLYFQF